MADVYASHGKVDSSLNRLYCLDMSRRAGKDFIMATMAIMECYKQRRRFRIPYAAPTKELCHDILVPTFEGIFQDCPPDLLPHEIRRGTFAASARELTFPWGAKIELIGVDLHPEWLRGTDTFCFFFTEPAFVEELQHLMVSILLPQLLTNPAGFGVMGSTPPVTAGHYWSTKMVPDAKIRGMYVKKTIYDNPRLGPEQVQGAIEMCGGEKTTQFQREFMCEHVTESTLSVIPEFAGVKKDIVVESPIPPYADTYVAIDPGFAHATGGVFAYVDFARAVCVVHGCFKTQGLNSTEVSRYVKAREWQLWGREPVKPAKWSQEAWQDELHLIRALFYPNLPIPPHSWAAHNSGHMNNKTYRRISDTDSRLIADLSTEHNLNFFPTEKQNVEAHTNVLRVNIQRKKFEIHPRCVELITDLEQAIWNKSRTKIAEGAGGHHYDTLPALSYLNRNLTWGRNPFPPNQVDPFTHHTPKKGVFDKTSSALKRAFTRR